MKKIILEVSLKPFYDHSEPGIKRVCDIIYRQWKDLTDEADTISILLWAADGSEILDYRGELNETFEWAKYIGVANPEIYGEPPDLPDEMLSIHRLPRLYRDNPPEYTYLDLKRVLAILRSTYAATGKKIRLGATFDPGPEFAKSPFKYSRHREICKGGTMAEGSFVCCYAELEADTVSYAGFPAGIESGTSFGTFLGRQSNLFCRDLGFDYLWLSNGFGFGLETWGVCGAIFDGEAFDSNACDGIKEKNLKFWKDFCTEFPDLPVETRGTNLSTAMDLASDAVPLREIYDTVNNLIPPPNSPWAALNGDFGAELAGWLSHIAQLPQDSGYPFRFYVHDPWFVNSPWIDRYGRQPHDIFLPLSVSRLDAQGDIQLPDSISLLTIDNSYGEMPENVPREIIPYIKEALQTAPDRAGPIVWLYPFDEYHDMTFAGKNVDEVFFGDWFIRTAVNYGLPLGTVVSTGNFKIALDKNNLNGNIIIAPTAIGQNPEVLGLLESFIVDGGKALLYGPLNEPAVQKLIGTAKAAPIDGEINVLLNGEIRAAYHKSIYSGGPLEDILADGSDVETIALATKDGLQRVIATAKTLGSGQIAWVRGTNSFEIGKGARYPKMLDRVQYFHLEKLFGEALARVGFSIRFDKHRDDQPETIATWKRCRNALYMASYSPDMTCRQHLRLPEGAPVFSETETFILAGASVWQLPKASHHECRVFVDMPEDGVVKIKESTVQMPGVRRRLQITGLKNATLRFRPETGYEEKTTVILGRCQPPYAEGNFLKEIKEECFGGTVFRYNNINDSILISWQE